MHLRALARINTEPASRVLNLFLGFCHSQRWAQAMVDARPFNTETMLFDAAERHWREAAPEDVLEAFAAHPRIGDRQALAKKFETQVQREQGQVARAPEAVIDALAEANERYIERFGYIFIVCAAGKSAETMLSLLIERLDNPAELELKVAAGEQHQITRLRIQAWLEEFENESSHHNPCA
ncbi:MAG: 2-oxo-4-hydroxy-4-carboxy-5-ureidoimidazoline decarboxylase [Pseudomonadales bacterium]